MAHQNEPDPYLTNDLKHSIEETLKTLVRGAMVKYALDERELNNDDFQNEVIAELHKTITPNFQESLNSVVKVWTDAREGSIKKYFSSRVDSHGGTEPQRFLKVAMRCNSKGEMNEVLTEDIEPWIDSLSNIVTNQKHKKYLTTKATRKQVINHLKSMLEFPVSVKETPVKTHLTTQAIEALLMNNPEKYLPAGGAKLIDSVHPFSDLIVVAANVLEYNNGRGKHRIEARIKSSEALKWAKYITGSRADPLYDGIGALEIGNNLETALNLAEDALQGSYEFAIDYRLPITLKPKTKPTLKQIKESYNTSEEAIMNLLKSTYLVNGELEPIRVKQFKKPLIYGVWLDMNLKINKSPIEVQFKDTLGHLLYGFNSPFGHNSKAYNTLRVNELHEQVEINKKKYSVDKITSYINKKILLPAFIETDRTY